MTEQAAHDHDHAGHDHADHDHEGVPAADLTLDSIVMLAPTVAMVVLDGEGVMLDEATRATHLLNASAALAVQCLDGTVPLGVVCEELSAGIEVPLDVVQRDVLALVRDLGDKGLLDGVRATPRAPQAPEQPTLPVGTVLSGLEGALDGSPVDDGWLAAGPALLVSWSPGCGYCTKIINDLAEAGSGLAAAGVRLALVTTATPDAVRAQFGDRDLLPVVHADQVPDFFAGLGTPIAYATDAAGGTTERMALGANEVPALARRLAGLDPV